MAKLSGITTPSLTFDEGAAPATPAAGDVILYAKTDGLLYSKDDAGTETVVTGTGAGGSVATDAIWDAAGDLAVGSGANTAARLAIGNAGAVLARINGAVAWNAGTSFPTAATGDRYFRTDRGLEYYYDGTRWLTVNEYEVSSGSTDALLPMSVSAAGARWPVRQDYGIYLNALRVVTYVTTTNDGSNYWTAALQRRSATNTSNDIVTFSTGTGPDTASNWVNHDQAINAVLDSSARELQLAMTKVSSAGTLHVIASLTYRLIG